MIHGSAMRGASVALCALTLLSPAAKASITVLIGEPFGNFGTMMPVGHAAVYLDHLCADGPLHLRECQPGAQEGVVLARYHRLGQWDWVASPVMQFLYATDRPSDVPEYVTPDLAYAMRNRYRAQYLPALVPDGQQQAKATEEWWETSGVAFNRKIWGYRLDTTREQDLRFMDAMNSSPNRHLYHLRKTNCANFAADMVNLYFPGVVQRGDHIADFGLMTPKQVARSVAMYGQEHPELHLQVLEIPQVPGSLRRSRPVRGAAESGLKIKRYLFTLLVVQPEIPIGLTFLYLDHGRWEIGKGAVPAFPAQFDSVVPTPGIQNSLTASRGEGTAASPAAQASSGNLQ